MKTLQKERDFLASIASNYVWNEVKKVLPVDEYGVKVQVKTPRGSTKWMSFKDMGPIQLEEYLNQDTTVKLKSNSGETKWLNVDDATMLAIRNLDFQLHGGKVSKKEDKYNVVSLRNGKKVIWNSIPLSRKEADDMAKQLQRATIPSVDENSINIVKVGVNRVNRKVAEVDNKKSDKRKSEAITWVNNIKDESTALLTEVQRMPVVDKAQVKLILNWVELIEGAINNIKKGLK